MKAPKPVLPDKLRRGGPRVNKGLYNELQPGIEYALWKKIITRMLELVGEAILSTPTGFLLPAQLGMLVVEKIKRSPTSPFYDWIHFCKTGEKKPNYNRHTFQHIYRIVWVPLRNTRLPTRELWKFKASRALNRALAQKIFGGADYLTLAKNRLPIR